MERHLTLILLLTLCSLHVGAQHLVVEPQREFFGTGIYLLSLKGGGADLVLSPEAEWPLGKHLDAGIVLHLGLHTPKDDPVTLVGAAPFLRLHFHVLDNFMDPFVDFCLGADRQRFDSGEKSQYTVDAGIRPGIRIAFLACLGLCKCLIYSALILVVYYLRFICGF